MENNNFLFFAIVVVALLIVFIGVGSGDKGDISSGKVIASPERAKASLRRSSIRNLPGREGMFREPKIDPGEWTGYSAHSLYSGIVLPPPNYPHRMVNTCFDEAMRDCSQTCTRVNELKKCLTDCALAINEECFKEGAYSDEDKESYVNLDDYLYEGDASLGQVPGIDANLCMECSSNCLSRLWKGLVRPRKGETIKERCQRECKFECSWLE